MHIALQLPPDMDMYMNKIYTYIFKEKHLLTFNSPPSMWLQAARTQPLPRHL